MRKSSRAVLGASLALSFAAGCAMPSQIASVNPKFSKFGNSKRENFFAKIVNPAYEKVVASQLIAVTAPGQALQIAGASVVERLPYGSMQLSLIQISDGTPRKQVLDMVRRLPGVSLAAENVLLKPQGDLTPKDDMAGMQWGNERIKTYQGWKITKGSPEVVVAVLDTGIDYDHPEFAGRIINGPNLVWVKPPEPKPGQPATPINPNDPKGPDDPKDDIGHGTHVAGIIAAAEDGKGVVGVAPNIKIMNVKVLGKSGGSIWTVAQGVRYASMNGAKIINMSLGGVEAAEKLGNFDLFRMVCEEARKKGVLVVAAAGNNGLDLELVQKSGVNFVPAMYSSVLNVGASREDDSLAPFSNRGNPLQIVAPGQKVLSTTPTYPTPFSAGGMSPNYDTMSGTSMATPFVAGLAGLVASVHPDWTPDQLQERILTSGDDLGVPGRDQQFGYGRINVEKALAN